MKSLLTNKVTVLRDRGYQSLKIMLRKSLLQEVTFKQKLTVLMYFHNITNNLDRLRSYCHNKISSEFLNSVVSEKIWNLILLVSYKLYTKLSFSKCYLNISYLKKKAIDIGIKQVLLNVFKYYLNILKKNLRHILHDFP
jgi:hypothetical protein